jgi:hypothetical protein
MPTTLTATTAMKARLATAAPTASQPPVQHAADKAAKKPPLVTCGTCGGPWHGDDSDCPKPASDEAAKINTPAQLDPELVARRKERDERQNALFLKLRAISPALFTAIPPPPMAIGMHNQILERLGCDVKDLRAVLSRWSRSPRYLKALASGVMRVNLDGSEAGKPTRTERDRAVERLAELKAKRP